MAWPTHIVSAAGIVENENGEILMVKLKHRGWEYPGGIVEVGENVIDGLLREIKEESGIDVEVISLLSVNSNTVMEKYYDGVTDVPTKVNFDFLCRRIGGELRISDETSEVKWIPKEEALKMITAPFAQKKFQMFLESKGKVNFTEYINKPKFEIKVLKEL